MNIFESGEDYLERILMLKKQNKIVRAIDIATSLGYSRASVSVALKKLNEEGYITIVDRNIDLTKKGLKIANEMLERHQLLTNMLVNLGVPYEIAEDDACKIEHHLSKESYKAIKNYLINNKVI